MDANPDPVTWRQHVDASEAPNPDTWQQMVTAAKAGANWWPTIPHYGRPTQWEGETVYPISIQDQLEAEITHRLALLAPLVDPTDQADMIMKLRQMDADAALRLCVALFPWGWPDQCGAGDWWLTALGRQAAKALVHRPEFQGPMTERGAVASSQYNVAQYTTDRTRRIFSKGVKPTHRKPEHWPYQRGTVLGRLVTIDWTVHHQAREIRATHRWLRRRLGLTAG